MVIISLTTNNSRMIILLSPSKTLDFQHEKMGDTIPHFVEESLIINKYLKKYSRKKLSELMHISDKLAFVNHQRNQEFDSNYDDENSRAAIYAFKGGVYLGLKVEDFNKNDLKFANKHLRILSGLYGLLRPLDRMQAYRLEMGTNLKIGRKKNLYEFWGAQISKQINESLLGHKNRTIINLASKEYFKAVQLDHLNDPVINIDFKEYKDDKLKFISFNAKKARGLMSHYIIKNKLQKPEDIKGFNYEEYSFDDDLSNDLNFVFTR